MFRIVKESEAKHSTRGNKIELSQELREAVENLKNGEVIEISKKDYEELGLKAPKYLTAGLKSLFKRNGIHAKLTGISVGTPLEVAQVRVGE